jgi:hypothetical protein
MEDPSSSRIHIQPTVVSNLLTRKSALKTVVVSDEEKAQVMRQVGIGKTSVSESLLKCRKSSWHRNRGDQTVPG